ncbi:MAG: RIO1 family regulatory kinase/ATPase [Candidatus Promineifilaceae bacterium]
MRTAIADEIENILDFEEAWETWGKAGRSRRARPSRPAGRRQQGAAELSNVQDDVAVFVPSYAAGLDPHHHERQWVIESVAPFYQDNLVADVLRRVRAGKEANVYCCQASEAAGGGLLAVKLYRPRMLRTLKNDADYKAGRQLRDEGGKQLRGRREQLALAKKTRFGKGLDAAWWIGNECRLQSQLYLAGADVPRPVAHQGNAILMAYVGDEAGPAPALSDVSLPAAQVRPLFERVMANVQRMLDHHLVHADLSAFNILYWEGRLTLIDFPQMVDARKNPNAKAFLERDVRRVCDYFGRQGLGLRPERLASGLWDAYLAGRSV